MIQPRAESSPSIGSSDLTGIRVNMRPIRSNVLSFTARLVAGAAMLVVIVGIALNVGCSRAGNRAGGGISTPPADAPADSDSGDVPFINSIGMSLAEVDPGEFVMGSPVSEAGHDLDETQHKVRITRPFFLGVYPVTQREYVAVMGTNPSYSRGEQFPEASRGDLPVDSVSWDDASAFCKKLSAKEGRTYRLPTEAEREYVCRAGSSGPYAGDGKLDDIGWYLGNSGDTTHPVGTLQPNDWGFYDMQGNVWEWCSDWYGEYPPGDAVDPTGPATGTRRVLRGGAFGYDPEYARAAFRNFYIPDARAYHNGFRVALDARTSKTGTSLITSPG
jgi:formylglycine-generating enzyme required for sulfatase activity